MHTCLDDPQAILSNEKATLTWLCNSSRTIANLQRLYISTNEAMVRFDPTHGMSVILNWNVLHESGNDSVLEIHVGGLIELNGSSIANISYFLCISKADAASGSPRRVLRKYHFDFADPRATRCRPHPVFHLQYPGTLPPGMGSCLTDAHMDAWFEEPRIFYSPMSLAMLLHMAFREFPDEYTERIRKDGYWLKLLRRDQELILAPFYDRCLKTITRDKKVVLDVAYGA